MAKNNNDDNEENKKNDSLSEVAENLKNAISRLISQQGNSEGLEGEDGVPVELEVTIEKNGSEKEQKDDSDNEKEQVQNTDDKQTETETSAKEKKSSGKKEGRSNSGAGSIVTVEQTLPVKLPLIALYGHPIFPGIFTPLMLSTPDDVKTVEDAFEGSGFVGLVLAKSEEENASAGDLYDVGTAARIIKKINLPDGGVNIFVSTVKRFKIRRILSSKNPIAAAVQYLDDEEGDTFETKALTRALISEMKEISDNNPLFSEEMRLNMVNIDNPGKIADFVASILNVEKTDQQKVLEELNIRTRLEKVLVFIKKEQELLRIQKKIQNELNEKIEKNQREYFLREEMKSIQDELGIGADGEGNEYSKFKKKIDEFKFEGEVKESVENELEKFKLMDPNSSEYFVSRNYLELVCALPWNEASKENLDLAKAYKILEKDHYGLDDVKKRILEYLAVRKMKDDSKGSILILVGPPGVGKTSIGHSIADAMNRPFYRFSVGGMRDEAEIKGHRRTYIGAMPGKILQGLKITKTKSTVFMIDEVDKMGSSAQGDPASALLEVLDPEQNVTFRDSYLDLPFDISDVFFILTANTLDSIPGPLLDRAEIIQLSGYIDQEKLEIAKKYLIPKNLVKNGLAKGQVKYTKAALLRIAEEYAREAGVRNYEKCIDKIHRKIITRQLSGIPEDIKSLGDVKQIENNSRETLEGAVFNIDARDLDSYLGKPVFDESEIKRADIPGTCIGLAWTGMGGDTLLIESISFPDSKGGLVLTGQMGDVMKESSQIAFNYVKQYAIEHKIKPLSWFDQNVVHLHIPEGATPKDGPSAGITMAVTFMSLLTGRIVKKDVAMTGELDLTGSVMPIGGLREKTVAAKRNGIKTIFIPKANERDLEEIPEIVKSG
uniref:endopeptidase La n=1 Tax=uncultured Treponema sp. TaxID=162155 RepID=UPI0015BB2BA4